MLLRERFINNFKVIEISRDVARTSVHGRGHLCHHRVKRVSNPAAVPCQDAHPRVMGGLGVSVVHVARPMTDREARAGLGGELVAQVW